MSTEPTIRRAEPGTRNEGIQRLATGARRNASLFASLLLLTAPVSARGVPLASDGGPRLSARSVLVLHNKTGKVLLGRNANQVRAIASLTKLQAALVFISKGLKLDRGTVINREDWKVALKGCRTRLELKWTYRNRDLLHAALLSSDNRAISALGRAVGLHSTSLVQAMNEKARKMGLRKTQFRGPVGIDPGNVSTAWEVARIVREAAKIPALTAIMRKKEHRVKPMKGYLKVWYRNTNPLVGTSKVATFLASKTGFNHVAGYCLASVAHFKGRGDITIVLLGSKRKVDRVNDLRRILLWLKAGGSQRSS